MSEILREWTEQVMYQEAVMREAQLRLVIRDRPRWLPDRVWRWAIGKLLVLEEQTK